MKFRVRLPATRARASSSSGRAKWSIPICTYPAAVKVEIAEANRANFVFASGSALASIFFCWGLIQGTWA